MYIKDTLSARNSVKEPLERFSNVY